MTSLIRYDAACKALAAAKNVDEVKSIRNHAEAMRAAARIAKNKSLEIDAAEIRIRAERRLGQIIDLQAKSVGLNKGGRPGKTSTSNKPVSSTPTLKEAGIDKRLSVSAQALAKVKPPQFEKLLGRWRKKVAKDNGRVTVTLLRNDDKRTKRAKRERDLGNKQLALPDKKFGVIVADPEWRFEPWSRETGMDRAADNHYPTSCTDVIAARNVPSIAADDCVLFLWATAPMLPHALVVMAAWGFDYRSHYVWLKDRMGTGYWNRNVHELLLIGVKGNIPAPAEGTQLESVVEARVIEAAVGVHSVKPECFLQMIEHYFPTLPKIELNRRGPARPGWESWGNEAEPAPIEQAAE